MHLPDRLRRMIPAKAASKSTSLSGDPDRSSALLSRNLRDRDWRPTKLTQVEIRACAIRINQVDGSEPATTALSGLALGQAVLEELSLKIAPDAQAL